MGVTHDEADITGRIIHPLTLHFLSINLTTNSIPIFYDVSVWGSGIWDIKWLLKDDNQSWHDPMATEALLVASWRDVDLALSHPSN